MKIRLTCTVNGDAVDLLADDYTVLTTDPRGINRSPVDDPDQDSTPQMRADDLSRLLTHLGAGPAETGDEVVLFGPGDHGEPTAQQWAETLGTISYEIVTRFTGKVPRSYCGVTATTEVAVSRDGGADGQVAAAL